MTDTLLLALLAGITLSLIFFMGLWWTVLKGLIADTPAAWFLLSFLLRMVLAVTGFYWIAQLGQWQHVLVALFGFIVTRMALSRWLAANESAEEKHHAS